MQFPVSSQPMKRTTAVVRAKGIVTEMDVQHIREVNGYLHILATPTAWQRSSTAHGGSSRRAASGAPTSVVVPNDFVVTSSGSYRFATSQVGTIVSLHFKS